MVLVIREDVAAGILSILSWMKHAWAHEMKYEFGIRMKHLCV